MARVSNINVYTSIKFARLESPHAVPAIQSNTLRKLLEHVLRVARWSYLEVAPRVGTGAMANVLCVTGKTARAGERVLKTLRERGLFMTDTRCCADGLATEIDESTTFGSVCNARRAAPFEASYIIWGRQNRCQHHAAGPCCREFARAFFGR
jgi:hypothetical protein